MYDETIPNDIENINDSMYGKEARKPIRDALNKINDNEAGYRLDFHVNQVYLGDSDTKKILNEMSQNKSAVIDNIGSINQTLEKINDSCSDAEYDHFQSQELEAETREYSNRASEAFEKAYNIKRKVSAPLGAENGKILVDENGKRLIGVVSIICSQEGDSK